MALRNFSLFYRSVMIFLLAPCLLQAQDKTGSTNNAAGWKIIATKNQPEKREDCGFVEADGKFYLLGGRGIKHVDVFDPSTNEWTQKKATPFEMHHFQALTYNHEIYVVGGMTGGFPHEKPLDNIYIYNLKNDEWRKGAEIAAERRRGSGGAVVYNNKIYLVCGIQDGHYTGTVTWLDEFDPATQKWQQLKDAPHARDHFNAAVINHKLYLAGGRRTSFKTKELVNLTVQEVDVYNFKNRVWKTLPAKDSLPTARAGCTAITYKGKLVVIGGESKTQESSHHDVEAFDTKEETWQTLPPLITGRHDTQAIFYKNKIYMAAGSANRGGGPDQSSIEVLGIR